VPNGPRSSFFMRKLPATKTQGGGVPDRIYPSGVNGGIRGGVLTDRLFEILAGYSGRVILGAARDAKAGTYAPS